MTAVSEWKRTIRGVSAVLQSDDEFEVKRDKVVTRLKRDQAYDVDLEMTEAVEALADAENVDRFDEALSDFYDWADAARMWIAPGQ